VLPINPYQISSILKAEIAALHKNGIEICQKVNGGISFDPTEQELGVLTKCRQMGRKKSSHSIHQN
jgi:hypothetical protein